MNRYKYEEYNEMFRKADKALQDIRLKCGDDGFPDSHNRDFFFYVSVRSVHNLFHKMQESLDDALVNDENNI